jgi:ketosteroid isomerase-like protein
MVGALPRLVTRGPGPTFDPDIEQATGESFATGSHGQDAEVAARFRTRLSSGDHSTIAEFYAHDVLFDVNVPEWRLQHKGPEAVRRQFDEWHPAAPDVVEWRERRTAGGLLVELALWEGEDHDQYSRSLHDLEISSGRISRHTMYCTGDWSEQAVAEAAAALVDA